MTWPLGPIGKGVGSSLVIGTSLADYGFLVKADESSLYQRKGRNVGDHYVEIT